MTDYWITIQVDPQRTRDIRVSADYYMDLIKSAIGRRYKIIAIRPCEKKTSQQQITHESL